MATDTRARMSIKPARDGSTGRMNLVQYKALVYNEEETDAGNLTLFFDASAEYPVLLASVSHIVLTAFNGVDVVGEIGDGSTADYWLEDAVDLTNVLLKTAGHVIHSEDGNGSGTNAAVGLVYTAPFRVVVTLGGTQGTTGQAAVIAKILPIAIS